MQQRKGKPEGASSGAVAGSSNGINGANPWTYTTVGLMISSGILGLYTYGLVETALSLPEITVETGLQQLLYPNSNKSSKRKASRRGLFSMGKKKSGGASSSPEGGTWPVSIYKDWKKPRTDDDANFETILHPGDQKTSMRVPKFWSKPVHHGKLMTREEALQIGTCVTPSKTGRFNRGEDCPVSDRTIFVSIASYRDFQCRDTIESMFRRARYPRRVRVGVVDQIVPEEDNSCGEPKVPCSQDPDQALCKYRQYVDVYQMDAPLAVGPVFARHVGHRLYRGEYYSTQSDAHVTFVKDWDVDIIDQLHSTENEMAVLSTYLTDIVGSIDEKTGLSLRDTRPIMCNTVYEGGVQGQYLRHLSQPEMFPTITGSPQLQPYWAAGYSFSRGHFVVNVPYDLYQPMIFQGEEMSIGIRGFSVGYDFYAPERSVCFHTYAKGKNEKKRNKVKHFGENAQAYAGTGKKAMQRLLGIVGMNPEMDRNSWNHAEEDMYGLGGVRTPEKFYSTFGIDVVKKETQHNLCTFVERGKMHRDFTPLLRPDGMGIEYGKITYQFQDPKKPRL